MTTHIMHLCPGRDGRKEYGSYGWPHEEVPINKERKSYKTNPECPVCHTPFSDPAFKSVSAGEIQLLNVNPNSSAYLKGQTGTKQQNVDLQRENRELAKKIDDLTKAVEKLTKKGGGN